MTITLAHVREIAANILDEYSPDYVYKPVGQIDGITSSCRYYHQGAPSCFVGRVFARLGFPALIEAAQWCDSHGAYSATQVIEKSEIEFERDARAYLDTIQEYQDGGDRWGVAVWMAEHNLGMHDTYVKGCMACDDDGEAE